MNSWRRRDEAQALTNPGASTLTRWPVSLSVRPHRRLERALFGTVSTRRSPCRERDVRLVGGVSDVGVIYAATDPVVHPAARPEGAQPVVVEARSSGAPVIASRIVNGVESVYRLVLAR